MATNEPTLLEMVVRYLNRYVDQSLNENELLGHLLESKYLVYNPDGSIYTIVFKQYKTLLKRNGYISYAKENPTIHVHKRIPKKISLKKLRKEKIN